MRSSESGTTGLSDALDVIETRKTGKSYFANRLIQAGELLLFELPVASVYFDDSNKFSEASVRLQSSISCLAFQVARKMAASSFFTDGVVDLCSNLAARTTASAANVYHEAGILSISLGGASIEWCARIIDKLLCNIFTIVGAEMDPLGLGLYLSASKFNHSCCPNAVQTFSGSHLQIRACSLIHTGEEVSISYIDNGQPTIFRRSELLSSYHFRCNCPKCIATDPFYGFKCPQMKCGGICRWDRDMSVIKYTMYMTAPAYFSASNEMNRLTWHHHFPYVFEMQGLLLDISSDGYIHQIENLFGLNYPNFSCSKCGTIVTVAEWILMVNKVARHLQMKSADFSWCCKYIELLRRYLHDTFYIVMESINDLVLKYIAASQFTDALTGSILSLPCFLRLYPRTSVIVAIQHFQQAKLYGVVGEREKAAMHVQESLSILAIVCGVDHVLYVNAKHYMISL